MTTGGVVAICTIPTLVGGVESYTVAGGMAHIRHAVRLLGADRVGVSSDRAPYAYACQPPELTRVIEPETLIPYAQAPEYPGGWRHIWRRYRETWESTTQPHALSPTAWPYNVTLPLVMEGYSDPDIRKIIGGNVMGLVDQVLTHKPAMG